MPIQYFGAIDGFPYIIPLLSFTGVVVNNDFRVGPWLVQPSLNTISKNGTSNRVEPKMMGVLVCLAEHTGEVVPKEKLLQAVLAGYVRLRRCSQALSFRTTPRIR